MKVLSPYLASLPGYFNLKRKFLEATRLSSLKKLVLMIEFWALLVRGGVYAFLSAPWTSSLIGYSNTTSAPFCTRRKMCNFHVLERPRALNEPDKLSFESQLCHVLLTWPWPFTSLNVRCFFLLKSEIIIILLKEGCCGFSESCLQSSWRNTRCIACASRVTAIIIMMMVIIGLWVYLFFYTFNRTSNSI